MATREPFLVRLTDADLANPQSEAARLLQEQRLKSLVLTDYHPRPGFGTQGSQISVVANFFRVTFRGRGKIVQHYDVDISPIVKFKNDKPDKDDRPPKKLPIDLTQKILDTFGEMLGPQHAQSFKDGAFDKRKNFFTPTALPLKGNDTFKHVLVIPHDEPRPPRPGQEDVPQGRRFNVTMKHASTIDLEAIAAFCRGEKQSVEVMQTMLTAIMAINVLIRQDPSIHYTPVGAAMNRFFAIQQSDMIGSGGLVGKGFFQSFRPALGHPGIQLDTAYSAFLQPGPLIAVAAQILSGGGGGGGRGGRGGRGGGGRGGFGGGGPGPGPGPEMPQELRPFDISRLRKILNQVKFKLTHRNCSKIFSIRSITTKSANELTFTLAGRDGAPDENINIAAYFKKIYGKDLRYPRLPCIVYGKNNFVPFEFVALEPFNQLGPTKLTSDQTADMIRIAAQRPQERVNRIMEWRRTLAYERLDKIHAWGLQVSTELTTVPARVLNAPTVQYAGGPSGTMRPHAGAWNLKGKRFFKPGAPLTAWSVVSFDRNVGIQDMQGFIGFFARALSTAGVQVATDRPPLFGPFNPAYQGTGMNKSVYDALATAAKAAWAAGGSKGNPQLIVVLLPGRDAALYEEIKRIAACFLHAPVVTQCLQAAKIKSDRGLDQYCANVAMKINAKLGGVTHAVPVGDLPGLNNRTMIVGADVTHPPSRGDDVVAPSIAATVASKNADNTLYSASIRLQEGRQEPITDLQSMMTEHLKIYGTATKYLPDAIIFYRDGVSEGQFSAVVQQEVKAIRMAAEALKPGYKPKVTFIACLKKHQTRFASKSGKDTDRSGNLPPGTCVDRDVTHPFAFDFYLQAHAGLIGTARPTHYFVLVDDSHFTPDAIQILTNGLSYSFARATRSVSIVSICYYADIICAKSRSMVYEEESFSDTMTQSSAGGSGPRGLLMEFDPLKIAKIFDKNKDFANVAWYM
ncbi:Protein argonaute [Naganishia albida]|nr:Protein argonaute [Naganishia albida]